MGSLRCGGEAYAGGAHRGLQKRAGGGVWRRGAASTGAALWRVVVSKYAYLTTLVAPQPLNFAYPTTLRYFEVAKVL